MTNFEKMKYLHRNAGKQAKKRASRVKPVKGEKKGAADEERGGGTAENIQG